MNTKGDAGSFGAIVSSQCFAFQRCHPFMSALPGAGCVGAPSIAQGAAGTFSSLLACFRLHAGSVFVSGPARNIPFSEIRT